MSSIGTRPHSKSFEMPGLPHTDENCDTGKPPRVLIVEDDFIIAMELEHRLLEGGIQVVGTAITAGEAVSMAETQKPDLVIMDIRLAGHRDGVEAAIEIFSTLGIRSIFASAHADNETRKRAAPALPIGWLQKPYPADDLLRLVRGFYQSRDWSAT